MTDFRAYNGEEFFNLEFEERKFLVDKIMRERDSILLVGGEKSGKSVLVQQLICSLTSGTQPFLDEYEIKKPCKVTYVAIEGEISDIQDRFKRMTQTQDINKENFQIVYSAPLKLQDLQQTMNLIGQINDYHNPDVIIIDPLYFACVGGSMKDDDHVIKFTSNIRIMKDLLGCAVIIVHHNHKIKMDSFGNVIDEGDDSLFGSAFLKAWPDHIFLFKYNKNTGLRSFHCNTQRSGDIVKQLTLRLVQPSPLYFEKVQDEPKGGQHDKSELIFDALVRYGELTSEEICKAVEIARCTFYRDIKKLISTKRVAKNDKHRPVKFSAKIESK